MTTDVNQSACFGEGPEDLRVPMPGKAMLPDGRWILIMEWMPTVQVGHSPSIVIKELLRPVEKKDEHA